MVTMDGLGFTIINFTRFWAKLYNIGPLISISLNNKSCYCYLCRSTKDSDQFAGDPEFYCYS